MTLTLIQMHGHPGSGKSTLARALGVSLPAVVIDKDVIASALIRHGVPFGEAGAPSYQVMYAQAARFLSDGHSVIFDSPCFWPMIEATTRRIAREAAAEWVMVETVCPDDLRAARLASRERLESNPPARDLGPMRPGMYHPACDRITVDTTLTLVEVLTEVRANLRTNVPPSPAAGEGLGVRV
jgi:predicted kinase